MKFKTIETELDALKVTEVGDPQFRTGMVPVALSEGPARLLPAGTTVKVGDYLIDPNGAFRVVDGAFLESIVVVPEPEKPAA